MQIDRDVAIPMDDGVVLRADVFRPDDGTPGPVIMTHGPYAKGLSFQEGYAPMWQALERDHPEVLEGSSNRFQNWETVDPEKWVPDGYVCIRVDCRGAGRSPGYLDLFAPREITDYAACIEWAGTQPWSTGKVGLLGISYYAMNQWLVAARRPKHLAALCPWEGASDYYREFNRHGGILNGFAAGWVPGQVLRVQHGVGDRGFRDPNTGELTAGPETLDEQELAANWADLPEQLRTHLLDDEFYRERSADLSRIEAPVLSAANWSHHLHSRGNFEGFLEAGSSEKWLEAHGLEHWTLFYTDYGVGLQKRFFGHFLKGEDTGWDRQPPVMLNLRKVDGSFEERGEQEWPLARTDWTRLYLGTDDETLDREIGSGEPIAFDATGPGVTFATAPIEEEMELTGPMAAKLFVSSSTTDADLFLTMRVLDPEGKDVTFISGLDPKGVPTFGYLRASQRKLDSEKSLPWRPYHPHDEVQPLAPGEVVELDVEIWPTSLVLPAGYRLAVTIQGRDFEFRGDGPWPEANGVQMRGHGVFVHRDADDRPADIFNGETTVYSEPGRESYLLVPVI
ncbi:MAG: CocE/NonD family hydrolase [Solirubrobacterales bacterium]